MTIVRGLSVGGVVAAGLVTFGVPALDADGSAPAPGGGAPVAPASGQVQDVGHPFWQVDQGV